MKILPRAYAEAVRLDPNFALAWARLSIVRSFLYYHGVDPSANSAAAVKEAADRAIALAPELGEAWLAQGTYRSRVLNDPAEAWKRIAKLKNVCRTARLLTNTWLMRSAGSVVGGKLKPTLPEQPSLTHATLGFGPVLGVRHILAFGRERQRRTQHYDRALEISPNDEFASR